MTRSSTVFLQHLELSIPSVVTMQTRLRSQGDVNRSRPLTDRTPPLTANHTRVV